METKRYSFVRKDVGNPETWEEEADIPIDQDPEEFLENLKKEFNDEEDSRSAQTNGKYKSVHIESLKLIGDTGVDKTICDFVKINKITLGNVNEAPYDIMQCKNCLIYVKRVGLGEGFNYKRECHPERICRYCNKEFKTEKLKQKHMEKDKHKVPHWLPDGV